MNTINIYHYAYRIFSGQPGYAPKEIYLTPTQWKIFNLLAAGPRTLKEIAIKHKEVTESALFSHIGNIRAKFGYDVLVRTAKSTYTIDKSVNIKHYE